MERILCLVPGLSIDHLDHRLSILNNNIERLSDSPYRLEFHLYNHENTPLDIPGLDRIVSGDLGLYQVFQLYDQWVDRFDYIIVLLDDVEIVSIDLSNMIANYNRYQMDIMSPSVTHDSAWAHAVMKTRDDHKIREVNFIELFCYILSPRSYHQWTGVMTERNTFGWGIDTNLKRLLGLKLFLFNGQKVRHHYVNTVDSSLPLHQVCVAQMREYNEYMGRKHNQALAIQPDYSVIAEFDS